MTILARVNQLELRLARDPGEIEAAQRLRYRVFYEEMGAIPTPVMRARGIDVDPFDAQCHHLVVVHRPSGAIVGTYRIQTTEMARSGRGLYTSTEFDLGALPEEIVSSAVEVGRACIEKEHRLKPVLFLLWKGLARYMSHNRRRWLFGPCSLTSQDPWDGARALAQLERRRLVRGDLRVAPQPGYECVWRGEDPDPAAAAALELPPLFEIYLRYAGRVCGPPVMFNNVISDLLKRGMSQDAIISTLERQMKCGIGKCQHCSIGRTLVCTDGPVYTYRQIKTLGEVI